MKRFLAKVFGFGCWICHRKDCEYKRLYTLCKYWFDGDDD